MKLDGTTKAEACRYRKGEFQWQQPLLGARPALEFRPPTLSMESALPPLVVELVQLSVTGTLFLVLT